MFTGVLSHQPLPWTWWVSLTLSLQNRCPSNIKSCIRISVQCKVNALLKFSVGSRTLEIWFCQFFWMLLFFLIFYRINYIIIHQLDIEIFLLHIKKIVLAVTHMALQKMTFSVRHKNNSTTFHVLLLNIYTQSFLIFYICLYLTKIKN